MSFILGATIAVNLTAVVLAIWLGLFLVSRSPKYLIAWMTALTLWLIAAAFQNVLLAINPPPVVLLKLTWLRIFFPFWPRETFLGASNNWLQGWSIAPALAIWHHVTILLLPGRTTIWRWVRILLAYLVAIIAVIVQINAPILFTTEGGNPLFLNSLLAGPWYPIFAVALVVLTWTCVYNLILAARSASSSVARNQLKILAWASLAAGLAGFVSIAASYFRIPIPILVISLLEAIPVALIGYSVARYSALMEGRTIQKDFVYSFFLLSLVLLIYVPISLILIMQYHAPMVLLAVFPPMAVITHSSMTAIDRLRDRIFYSKDTGMLRVELRKLSRQVGVNAPLEMLLKPSLESLCSYVEATYGLILIFGSETPLKIISCKFDAELPDIEIKKLTIDDLVYLKSGQLPPPLDHASLLVPLYSETEQLGALILGEPENGLQYALDDTEPILEVTDEFSETIQTAWRNRRYMEKISELIQEHNFHHQDNHPPVSNECIEQALRNLYDYPYLADTPLAEINLVRDRLPAGQITHLERGKA
ncbi:MAG: hypothetical protein FIA98_04030, partial [Anaerolineae bacterium]|nr:hypothetical protein [Anaerolineae bacterium]